MARSVKFTGLMSNGPEVARCDGALAVGTVIPNNITKTRRILVGGVATLTVRAKGSTVAGTPKIDIKGILQDGSDEDGTGTQWATGNATQGTLTSSEVLVTFTPNGARYADIIITCGAGDTYTIVYVDLFAVPVYG